MITDLDAALLCYSSYFSPMDFDVYETGENTNGVRVGVKKYPDCVAIVFEGSASALDWSRDFQASMVDDHDLGQVERGFLIGMTDTLARILPLLNKPGETPMPLVIVGHSLGAARALIFGAILQKTGKYFLNIVTFGSPRPGGARLAEILGPVTIRSYKNASDPVTEVPRAFPHLPYQHPREQIAIKCESITGDPWFVFRDHHIQNYVVATARHLGTYHA